MRTLRTLLSAALLTIIATLAVAVPPAATEERVPDDIQEALRTQALPLLAWFLQEYREGPVGDLQLGDAHAVHHFTDAYAGGDASATVLDPAERWFAPWLRDGEPGGLITVDRYESGTPVLGFTTDPTEAVVLLAWDGTGELVVEFGRSRWFALQGDRLVTLRGEGPLPGSLPVDEYAADIAAHLATQDEWCWECGRQPVG